VPSQHHEALVALFQNHPRLAADLLEHSTSVALPAFTSVRVESSTLPELTPAEYRADLVVLLARKKPVFAIVVEVQLGPDEDKPFSWPCYAANLRARFRCPCCVLVYTSSPSVARWACTPVSLGPGFTFVPVVVAPASVPIITDRKRARRAPELAVLSAMAHGKRDVQTALQIARAATSALDSLDEDTAVLYFDLVEHALSKAAKKEFAMIPEGYRFQGPTYKKGLREGVREGERVLLLRQLRLKFGKLPKAVELRVRRANEASLLTWSERVLKATSLEAVLEQR
jgi:hypothetical protein